MFICSDRADTPYFSPLPLFRWKIEFSSLPFNRIPHKTDRPYLRPKPYNSIRLLILHEVRLLLISDKQKLNRYVRNTRESQTNYGHSHFMGTKHGYRGVDPSGENQRGIPLFNGDEVLEWRLVTPWLAERLREQGEIIIDKLGCRWWGRLTSGQAIYMDGVIQEIYGND